MWGGWGGVSVKAESPGRARRGPPTSPPALYKRARSNAARQWLLHTHKEGVLAPQETVQLRIATTRAFGSVDYFTARSSARMKLVHVALLYLGSATFFGVDAARVDVATEFKRKWTSWVLSRAKRDVRPPGAPRGLGAAADVQALVRTQDVKDPRASQPSGREDAHIRVRRYRQSVNSYPHLPTFRMGCRFGTCTVQKLAHQLYQLTDKVKDGAAPVNKISPQGYGRRRRSLPDSFLRTVRAEPRAPVVGV